MKSSFKERAAGLEKDVQNMQTGPEEKQAFQGFFVRVRHVSLGKNYRLSFQDILRIN
jgi:hypothetical protein